MAGSRIALAVLLVASCLAAVQAQNNSIWGGATSIKSYAAAIINAYGHGFPPYASVGSGNGINGFTNGTYGIGASDDPPTSAQYFKIGTTANNASLTNGYTLPLTLGTYSLVTKKVSGLVLTPLQACGIYTGRITLWSQLKSTLTGTIIPVARADSSGTTELFGLYCNQTQTPTAPWPAVATTTASWKGDSGISSAVVYQTGSGGVAGYIANNTNAIGYVQTGVGINPPYNNSEVGLVNKDGYSVFASKADASASIPLPLPAANSTAWSSVSLINKGGNKTYPVVSFVYDISHKTYTTGGATIKAFLNFTQGSVAQGLASTYFFQKLPSYLITQNVQAIANIA